MSPGDSVEFLPNQVANKLCQSYNHETCETSHMIYNYRLCN
jgi:folate-binding Fe-S cluster repair protein YgfZ